MKESLRQERPRVSNLAEAFDHIRATNQYARVLVDFVEQISEQKDSLFEVFKKRREGYALVLKGRMDIGEGQSAHWHMLTETTRETSAKFVRFIMAPVKSALYRFSPNGIYIDMGDQTVNFYNPRTRDSSFYQSWLDGFLKEATAAFEEINARFKKEPVANPS